MRSCRTEDLLPGMILGKSLYTQDGELLLSRQTELDNRYITRLCDLGYTVVYIDEKGTEDAIPKEIISDNLRSLTHRTFAETQAAILKAAEYHQFTSEKIIAAMERGVEFGALVDVKRMTENIQSILDEIFDNHINSVECLFTRSSNG